jgi:hypothetical protein
MSTPHEQQPPAADPAARGRSKTTSKTAPPAKRSNAPLALAIVGVVLGGLALVVGAAAAMGAFATPAATASCQRLAWAGIPRGIDVQPGWTVQAPDFESARSSATLVGPAAADGTTSTVYVRVTCYGGSDAADALARLKVASVEAGTKVTDIPAGDGGFRIDDPVSGVSAIFRRGNLVGWAILSVGGPDQDLQPSLDSLDKAMQRAQGANGLAIPDPVTPAPAPSTVAGASGRPGASDAPQDSNAPAFAPDLEAKLPASVGGIQLQTTSYPGSDMFDTTTASGRAVDAGLTSLGKTLDDLQIAEANAVPDPLASVDPLANLDSVKAYRVPGVAVAKLEPILLNSILVANSDGVKTSTSTVAGKPVKVIDYGAGNAKAYVYETGDTIIVVSTTDEKIATELLTAMK